MKDWSIADVNKLFFIFIIY